MSACCGQHDKAYAPSGLPLLPRRRTEVVARRARGYEARSGTEVLKRIYRPDDAQDFRVILPVDPRGAGSYRREASRDARTTSFCDVD